MNHSPEPWNVVPLMRTLSRIMASAIAVPAQDPKPSRKPIALEPDVQNVARWYAPVTLLANLTPMLGSLPVDVIDRQKLKLRLTTAGTFIAVMFDDQLSEPSTPLFAGAPVPLRVRATAFSLLGDYSPFLLVAETVPVTLGFAHASRLHDNHHAVNASLGRNP